RDTALAQTAVIVHPLPQAGLRLSGVAGCTPYYVEAFDASPPGNAPIVDWEWDFGVPGGTDRQQNSSFIYTTPGVYRITLTVTDANGCISVKDTTIEAWPTPQADFVTRGDSFGCAPFPVTFLDQSLGPVPINIWKWRFGSGDSSTNQNPFYNYQNDGVYDVWLAVTDVRGCSDTLNKPQYINLNHPIADFVVDTTLGCPPFPVTFTDRSQSDTSLVLWDWTFGDGNVGSGTPIIHTYQSSGLFDVGLIVEDFFGCRDTVEKPELINVLIDRIPPPPPIRYVTVESDNSMYVEWNSYTDTLGDFGAYIIEQNAGGAGWVRVYQSASLNDTSVLVQNLQTRTESYCFRVLVENQCKSPSDPSRSQPHCAVRLVASPATDAIRLDWSAYKGWSGVDRYRIFRIKDYTQTNRILVATVPSDSFSILDTDMFCYQGFTYRIEAWSSDDDLISYSNIDESVPNHFPLGDSLHIVRSTVVDDDYVLLEWEKPFVRQGRRVILERRADQIWERLWAQPYDDPITSFEDRRTRVDEAFYAYRGFVVDSCGDGLPIGRQGRSMRLLGDRKGGTNYLYWSPYSRWKTGVKRYDIMVLNEDLQRMQRVASVDGNTTEFEDRTTDLVQVRYCYTIRAVEEDGGYDTTALSNEVCLYIDPIFYAPTAFSPNGDGHNETFIVPASSVGSYHLQLFNRWGNLIFETRNPEAAWDGTYKGQPVPEGVYVWTVYATGLTGRPIIEQTGTVTLIR
ncbi:MAG: PKD domain-containing protein, partial [Bacteroidia bacterium]